MAASTTLASLPKAGHYPELDALVHSHQLALARATKFEDADGITRERDALCASVVVRSIATCLKLIDRSTLNHALDAVEKLPVLSGEQAVLLDAFITGGRTS